MMDYRYIAIEGNIGAGKSTLAAMLSEHYQTRLILEEFKDNTFLPKFYEDPFRYGFPLELSFLADRYKQLKDHLVHGDLFKKQIIADYMFVKCKLFAKVNLKADEYDLFLKLFDIIHQQLPVPDLLIYLQAPIGRLQSNIIKRGRPYEQSITASYLHDVEEVYQQYLKYHSSPILIVDTSVADFLHHPSHFAQLTKFLDSGSDFQRHHLLLS